MGKITRRGLIGGAAGLAAASTALARPARGERPNILWLVSEDNNPFIGAYGDKLAHTPAIDALAAKGLLYRHVYSNAPVCAPSRFGILTGVYPESCAPANHMRANAHWPKELRTYPELLREAGYFCTNNAKTDYNCDIDPETVWDIQGAKGHWRARPAGKPFMAVFNYETTHESQIFRPTAGRVTPDMVTLPPYLPDTPGIRQDFASYHNLMERMDGQLAKRLADLDADGLADDTIIFHYSDNGGVLPRSKRYCYEEGLRCEMVVYVPPKWRHLMPAAPGSEITTPVSFIDLAPTLLSLAGIRAPAQMRGKPFLGERAARPNTYAFGMRNRMDERYDFQRTVTDGRWRYIRNYMPHRPLGQNQAFAWMAKGYQDWETAHLAGTLNPVQDRFFQPKVYEELYDLSADPHEINNLAGDPKTRRTMAALSRALDAHMLAINDNGFLPEAMAGEGYVESRNAALYPLKEVMALAAIAARGEDGGTARLTAALADKRPVMRYWAATGLLIRGQRAASTRGALEAVMRSDPSPQVQIVAAEAVARLGQPEEAVAILGKLCGPGQPWQVKLQAVNALTFIGSAARAAEPTMRLILANDEEEELVRTAARYLIAVLNGTYKPSVPIFDMQRMIANAAKGKMP
ncbi:sulfatase-like hydrolase/transferase [Sphingobium sp. CAP-1]|uniref:sulfatase-like hydrolase/transferase n=1 Tax=Sphingobium sp. CAP-1 TaxID=2676077 RepID=UPI0012BB3699|nr:sulfatase-like hydrolase/transferase [Sphingobium sp. CAP-1]QGP79417.1 sulfatase-like hydrolase/transferase [Sphingobium sp. CAP-1]